MFINIMMNLCCSKRQKNNDTSDQPLQQQEVQKQELQRQNSDEFRQRNQEAQEKRQKEQKVPGVITSLEMEGMFTINQESNNLLRVTFN
ncbi:hypothetical protein pb186bvf_008845 [Paramecium bursaria]